MRGGVVGKVTYPHLNDCLAKGPPLIAFLGFFFGGFLTRDDLGLGVGGTGGHAISRC